MSILRDGWHVPVIVVSVVIGILALITLTPKSQCRAYVPEPGKMCARGWQLHLYEHYPICDCSPGATP